MPPKAYEMQFTIKPSETGHILHHQVLLQKAESSNNAAFCGKENLHLQEAQAAIL